MKKKSKLLFPTLFLIAGGLTAQVGVGNQNPQGILDASNNQNYPVVMPQGPEGEIVNPSGGNFAPGSVYFDTELNCLRLFDGANWVDINCIPRTAIFNSSGNINDFWDFNGNNDRTEIVILEHGKIYPDTSIENVPASAQRLGFNELAAQPFATLDFPLDGTSGNFANLSDLYIGQVIGKTDNGAEIVITDTRVSIEFENDGTATTLEDKILYRTPFSLNTDGTTATRSDVLNTIEIGIRGAFNPDDLVDIIYPPFVNDPGNKELLKKAIEMGYPDPDASEAVRTLKK